MSNKTDEMCNGCNNLLYKQHNGAHPEYLEIACCKISKQGVPLYIVHDEIIPEIKRPDWCPLIDNKETMFLYYDEKIWMFWMLEKHLELWTKQIAELTDRVNQLVNRSMKSINCNNNLSCFGCFSLCRQTGYKHSAYYCGKNNRNLGAQGWNGTRPNWCPGKEIVNDKS